MMSLGPMFQLRKKNRFKPNTDMMIECHHVSKRYTQGFGLKQINLSLPNGAMGFLIGHSGAGKSSLIKLIIQQELLSSGLMQINQQVFLPHSRSGHRVAKLRKSIGIIFNTFRTTECIQH